MKTPGTEPETPDIEPETSVSGWAPLENLKHRAGLLRTLRRFFDDRGFCEVQTPTLSADTIVDRFVEPVAVDDETFPVTRHGTKTRYLQTSPEFAMKRLLVAGMGDIYQIGPVFRRGDRGPRHNVEFTMLEWYRLGQSYREAMAFLTELVRKVGELHSFGSTYTEEISSRTYGDVFQEYTGLNPHRATAGELRRFAEVEKISFPDSYTVGSETSTDLWLDLLFAERVQPNLDAVIVYDYPGSQSQLAVSRTDPATGVTVGERFELFLGGLEIANGYHESADADELRRRFEETARKRRTDGSRPLPVESRLLDALRSGLPPCCGVALGVDRLLMVLLGAASIDEVLAFPFEIA